MSDDQIDRRVTAEDLEETRAGLQAWAAERELVAYKNFIRRILADSLPEEEVEKAAAGATEAEMAQLFYPLVGVKGPAGSILTRFLLTKG